MNRTDFSLAPLALALSVAFGWAPSVSLAETAPPLMLAKVYQRGAAMPGTVADYWVSEKYDGVRGYWNGQKLLTRSGEPIAAPAWFTAGWPDTPMEGELWAGRGQFASAVSAVRQLAPDEAAWRQLKFMVFDLPGQPGTFSQRLTQLNSQVNRLNQAWVQPVAQTKVANPQALQALLASTMKLGGEGLMLHRGDSPYQAVRSDDLLKFKPFDDAEARVVAHVPGKGKYVGKLGALMVEIPATGGQPARRFKLGTGLSDAQRENPPAVGETVTYRYQGLTSGGLPRFATFMRIREY
jgi:DNA ligase-1